MQIKKVFKIDMKIDSLSYKCFMLT